jgi:hypothetical protein
MIKLQLEVSARVIQRISELIDHNQDDMTIEEKAAVLLEVGLNFAEDADKINSPVSH